MEMKEINGKYFEFKCEGLSSRDASPRGNQYKYEANGNIFIIIQEREYTCYMSLNFSVPTLNDELVFIVKFKATLKGLDITIKPNDEVYIPEGVVQSSEQMILNNIAQHSIPSIQTEIIRCLTHHLVFQKPLVAE